MKIVTVKIRYTVLLLLILVLPNNVWILCKNYVQEKNNIWDDFCKYFCRSTTFNKTGIEVDTHYTYRYRARMNVG